MHRHIIRRACSRCYRHTSLYLRSSFRGLHHPQEFPPTRPNGEECFPSSPRFFSTAPDFRGQYRLLTDQEIALVEEQRELSKRAREVASQVHGIQVKTDSLLRTVLGENDLSTFSIVIAGEFNSGKSTMINALLGTKLLETGALPTTDSVIVLTHGSKDTKKIANIGTHAGVVIHQLANIPLLQDLTLVDTPGTNAVVLNHTDRTLKLLPSADLILFVTSAERPFSESERAILKSIQAYRKHIVIVLNKMDVLETAGGNYGDEEKRRVVEFVSDNASDLLGARPIVIPISARDAISTKLTFMDENSSVWKRSNFGSLESFLRDTLTTETKVKAKLCNPVGVVEGIMDECLRVLEDERKELSVDIATLNLLRSQFQGWEKETNVEFETFRREVGSTLSRVGERCQRMCDRMNIIDWYMLAFDDTSFSSLWKRINRSGPDSTKGPEETILDIARETADSVATSTRAQGQAVIEYLGKRPAVKSLSLIGSVTAASSFEDTRQTILDSMSDSVRSVLREYDEAAEEDSLLQSFRMVAYFSGALQLGALSAVIATSTSVFSFLPGLAGAAALATSSLFVLSHGTRRVSSNYEQLWEDRQSRLDEILTLACRKEMKKGTKILIGIAPYTRYVETEQGRISSMTDECETVQASAQVLRNRISKLHRYS